MGMLELECKYVELNAIIVLVLYTKEYFI